MSVINTILLAVLSFTLIVIIKGQDLEVPNVPIWNPEEAIEENSDVLAGVLEPFSEEVPIPLEVPNVPILSPEEATEENSNVLEQLLEPVSEAVRQILSLSS